MVELAKPVDYGQWWNTNQMDEAWYQRIFDLRRRAHEQFLDWFCQLVRRGERIESILEVGCGRGIPYARIFDQYDYHGSDISEKEIAFCREQYGADERRFFTSDAVRDDLGGPYDLVFSHAVVDHVYDVDGLLRNLAAASRGWVYVSAYAGWYPRLVRHEYRWEQEVTCYQNAISPAQARAALVAAGCRDVEVFPVFVANRTDDIAFETAILARGAAAS